MDLSYAPEDHAFADMVGEWVDQNLPEWIRRKVFAGEHFSREEYLVWPRILYAQGWSMPSWPKEFGGPGWTLPQRHLFTEIATVAGAPYIRSMPEKIVGPLMIGVGTPDQQAHYLPRILSFEDSWCQGCSEPNAGSDLTALTTRADLDGDEWVVNGAKIWTSAAHESKLMLCLLRTDQEQKGGRGLSQLIIPMDTPGITVSPILSVVGEHHFNQVFFDNVRVPKENIVGEPGKAWGYARIMLANERFNFARLGESKRHLKRLKAVASQETDGSGRLIDNPMFRAKVASAEIALRALEVTTLRLMSAEQTGQPLGGSPNIVKLKGADVEQQLLELIMDAMGPYGAPFDGRVRVTGTEGLPEAVRRAGVRTADYLESRKFSIAGGSSEVQKNMMARHQLKL